MLILTRRMGERILINQGEIILTVLSYYKGQTRLGLDAPKAVDIAREEVFYRDQANHSHVGHYPFKKALSNWACNDTASNFNR